MAPSTLALLAFCILAAAVSYYLGFVRPPRVLAWLSQAAFVVFTFLLIPILLLVLWRQFGAEERLAEYDITPHPAINHALGIATGSGGRPLWMFSVEAAPESVVAFYRDESHRPGWEIVSDGNIFLLLGRGNERMMIGGYEGWSSKSVTYNYSIRDGDPEF